MTNKQKSDVTVSVSPRSVVAESPAFKQLTPFEEVERLFERLMPQVWIPPSAWNWPIWSGIDESRANGRTPPVDLIELDAEMLIRVEVPGVEKKDLEVSILDHAVSIKGHVKRPAREEKFEYSRCEILPGDFSRTVALPNDVDTTKISANLQDGVLEIHLPKGEQAKRRSVEIK
jgi:HSP20 family protein